MDHRAVARLSAVSGPNFPPYCRAGRSLSATKRPCSGRMKHCWRGPALRRRAKLRRRRMRSPVARVPARRGVGRWGALQLGAGCDSVGIDPVVLGLAVMDGLHVQGAAEDEAMR